MIDDTTSRDELLAHIRMLEQRVADLETRAQGGPGEEALRDSERRFRGLFEQSSEGITITDDQGRIIEWNPAMETITGIPRQEAINTPVWDLQFSLTPDEQKKQENYTAMRDRLRALLDDLLVPRRTQVMELEIQRPDGTRRTVQNRAFLIETGGRAAVGSILWDVTGQKNAENALRESEQRYRSLVESIRDAVAVFDRDWRYVVVNQPTLALLGRSEAQVVGQRLPDLFPGVEDTGYFAACQRVMETRQPEQVVQATFESADPRWYDVYIYPVEEGILTVAHNITPRLRVQEALRESEERFRGAFEHAAIGVALVSTTGRFLQVNAALCAMLGYSQEELLATDFQSVTHPDDVAVGVNSMRRMAAGEIDVDQFEKRYIHKDGSIVWALLNYSTVRDAEGRPCYFVSQVQNVTARKWAETELIKSEQKYRHLFENAQAGIMRVRFPGGLILDANQRLAEIFGYTTGPEITGHYMTEFYADRSDRLFSLLRQQGSVRHYVVRGRRADGEEIWVEGSYWLGAENDDVVESVIVDITQRKHAEDALREARDQLEAILGGMSDAIFALDTEGRIVYVNAAAARAGGHPSADALRGMPADSLLGRFELTDETGHPIPADQLPGRLALAGIAPPPLAVCFREPGEPELHWGIIKAAPIRDAQGSTRFSVIILTDITRHKQIEQQQFDLAVERERIQVLERFIGDATHDLYTPLSAIKVSLHALEHLGDPAQQRPVETIKRQADRLEHLLNDLLSMVQLDKETDLHYTPLDLNQLVGEVLAAHAPILEQRHHATVFLPTPGALPVLGDYDRLDRAVAALVANAVSYTPDGGIITVRTLASSDEAVVEVADTGIGISPLDLPHIFKRFYRADAARSAEQGGMGLGLPIAKKIVEAHRGRIEVDTRLGGGSTFRVALPLAPLCTEG